MRAVVGDVRLPTGEVESSVLYYYFPYGFLREGGSYRYGYNGQERSDNINGLGNHTTAFYWEYSTHYARRWNTDPKPVAGLSPYSVFQGNPILFTDVLGDTSDYFDKSSGNFLGRDFDTKKSDVLLINQKDYNAIHGNQYFSEKGKTEALRGSSSFIYVDPSAGNYFDPARDNSNIGAEALANIYNYYIQEAGYNLSLLKNNSVIINFRMGAVAKWDQTLPIGLKVDPTYIGKHLQNRFDFINLMVHEIDGHLSLLKSGYFARGNNWTNVEGGATLIQVQHASWVQTSTAFKQHMLNVYGFTFSEREIQRYWGRYGVGINDKSKFYNYNSWMQGGKQGYDKFKP